MMRGHAQAGYDILKDVPFPTPVAEIIRRTVDGFHAIRREQARDAGLR